MRFYFSPIKKGKRSFLIFSLLTFSLCFPLRAQFIVSGTILEPDGEPVIGANVIEESTGDGTITDLDGNFSLSLTSEHSTLVVSYVGFSTQKIFVNGLHKLDITMEEDMNRLDELVVVGYGVQKKSVVTGAISSIKPKEITETPVANVEQAIQGRSSGVQVVNDTGQPDGAINIRIRGAGTNGFSQPLFIVDGMQVEDLSSLSPNDIESMEILKDAASAAIYGSRAANGVILVTTQKGEPGKMIINYDGYFGIQNAWKKVDVLNANQYMQLLNEARTNDGVAPIFSPEFIANNRTDTNWQDAMFTKNAPITNHQVSLSGGGERSIFYASTSYFLQEGIVGGAKSNFERFTLRLNSEHRINSVLKVGQNLNFSNATTKGIQEQDDHNSILSASILHDPLTPVIETDPGRIDEISRLPNMPVRNSQGQFFGISDRNLREVANPLARLENTFNKREDRRLIGNFYGLIEPMENMVIRSDFGIDFQNGQFRDFTPEAFYNPVNIITTNSANNIMDSRLNWQWENYGSYTWHLNDHNITALVGMTAQRFQFQSLSGTRFNINPANFDDAWLGNGDDDATQKK